MKKKGSERKKLTDGRFYSSIVSTPYHCRKLRLAEAKQSLVSPEKRNIQVVINVFRKNADSHG